MIEIADVCPHLHKIPEFVGHPAVDSAQNIFPKWSCFSCFTHHLPDLLRVIPPTEVVENLETSAMSETGWQILLSNVIRRYADKLASLENRPSTKSSSGLTSEEKRARADARTAERHHARIEQQRAVERQIKANHGEVIK